MTDPVMQAKLDNWFMHHLPEGDDADLYAKIREAGKRFAEAIASLTPPSADQTVAIRHVRDAVMNANAAIACDGK